MITNKVNIKDVAGLPYSGEVQDDDTFLIARDIHPNAGRYAVGVEQLYLPGSGQCELRVDKEQAAKMIVGLQLFVDRKNITTGILVMKRIVAGLITIITSTSIVSCDGSSGGESTVVRTASIDANGCASIEGTGSGGALGGVYDISNYTAPTVNVVYAAVSRTGAVTEYDYDADSVGSGLNCYFKRQDKFSSFTHKIGEQYWWTFANPFPDETNCAYVRDEVNIVVTNGGASFSTPEFGQYAAWRKLGSLTVDDLQLCGQ